MLRFLPLAFIWLVAPVAPLEGQQAKTAAEKAVWSLIEATSKGHPKVTDDVVFVSGAYPRPIIGRQHFAAEDTASAKNDMMNVVRRVRPQRVVVSTSGDMAYGFALFNMEFDRPDSAGKTEHVKFEGSQLTVWRKVDADWRLAASFNRPNE